MTDTSNDATTADPPRQRICQNCGAPLLGDHCYACGQPVKGLVRHFSSILGDFFDSVLNIDSRLFRTIGPLLFKPGQLTLAYFAGHRVRYVSPVRLFFFLSIVTFFIAQLTFNFDGGDVRFNGGAEDSISRATTVIEVERVRDEGLKEIAEARDSIPANVPGARAGVDVAADAIRDKAGARIAELRQATASGKPPPVASDDDKPTFMLFGDDKPWDPVTNPVKLAWLPDFANDWVNAQVSRAEKNIARMQEDPNLFKDAVLSAVPATLFVLLPVFALMLKLAYAFKRRLYMEHLIVALHSHAFLCLALLLMFVLNALDNGLGVHEGAAQTFFNLAVAVLWIWMLLYLLLMQKRVYAQGWPMTLLKYCVLGVSYFVLLSLGAGFTVLASLVWM